MTTLKTFRIWKTTSSTPFLLHKIENEKPKWNHSKTIIRHYVILWIHFSVTSSLVVYSVDWPFSFFYLLFICVLLVFLCVEENLINELSGVWFNFPFIFNRFWFFFFRRDRLVVLTYISTWDMKSGLILGRVFDNECLIVDLGCGT